ncbi:NADH-quinone oxidoreductase subunit D-related protein [Mariniluteicoccus flavus]
MPDQPATPALPRRLRFLVGSMAAGIPGDATTIWLDLGADHPSHAGLLELCVAERDGVVTEATVVPGAMHRGVEKLFEVRDYRQILSLADRHDWQAPFFGELLAATAVEQMLGLEVPPRAAWLRTLLAEHTRILSHLGFLTWVARDTEHATVVRRAREELREQTRRLTGNRIHPMVVRLGGLGADATPAWLADEVALVTRIAADLTPLSESLPGAGVGLVDEALVDAYGLSGPLARAAGLDLDLRRTAASGPYAELADLVPAPTTEGAGDARARFSLLLDEVGVSARLVEASAERVPDGPIDVRLPKIVKLPDDEAYAAVEAPLGRSGLHVVSRGDKTPWRMKLRTPSFHHAAALEAILPGTPVGDVECVLASIGHVIGDLDK